MSYAIGIDVGGTNTKMVAVTPAGILLYGSVGPTEADQNAWISYLRQEIAEIEEDQGYPAEWIGLAAPGLAAADGRSIAWMQGRLEMVQGLNWTEALGREQPIPVLNDAHAALLGEAAAGAAAGCRNVMLLTLGTGVGGGAMVDGRLLRGAIGRAGHLGHISLNPDGPKDIVGTPGSLEDAIGDCTIRERTQGRFSSTADLVRAHEAGDAEATAVWLRSIKQLACGVVSLVNVLDPEVVILGGGTAKAGPTLFTPLQEFLDEMEWRPTGSQARLVAATLGDMAGAFGAAHNAMPPEFE